MTKPAFHTPPRRLAVVTGASGDLGLALARQCADAGHDLVLCADRGALDEAAFALREGGAAVDAVHCDAACGDGLYKLTDAIGGRPVDALLICAEAPLAARGFLDQDFDVLRHAVDTQVTRLLAVAHLVGRGMRDRGHGRILIAGGLRSEGGGCAGLEDGLKAFFDGFTCTLREELKAVGVSVTVLLPGPGDARFFARGSLLDTTLGSAGNAGPDPNELASIGYRAMCDGQGDVVAGLRSRLQAMLSGAAPDGSVPAANATARPAEALR